MKKYWLNCTAIAIASCFNFAQAQEAETNGVGEWTLEKVVTTAQKRDENLQDVPVAVTAYSGAQIDRFKLDDSTELGKVVPGLNMGEAGGHGNNPLIFLRGIGLNDFSPNNPGPVAVYLDELYISSIAAQVFQLFDLERVEVLKGPQGTLYGRNATGGAIKLIPAGPTENFSGSLRAQYGRYDTSKFEAIVSGPLGDKTRGRLAVVRDYSDGDIKNVAQNKNANGVDSYGYRGTLEADLSENVTGSLMLSGSRNKTDIGVSRMFPAVTSNFEEDYTGALGCPTGCTDFFGNTPPANFYAGSTDLSDKLDIEIFNAQATFGWSGDNFSLKSITGYQELDRISSNDGDSTPTNYIDIANNVSSEVITQEVQLSGKGQRYDWLVGAFYLDETLDQDLPLDIGRDLRPIIEAAAPGSGGFDPGGSIIGIPAFTYRARNKQNSQAFALFSNIDYDLTDRIGVTAGLRFTDDKKEWDGFMAFEEAGMVFPLNDPSNPNVNTDLHYIDDMSDQEISWKVGIDFKPNPKTLLYGHVSTGFKSGGYNGGYILDTAEQRAFAPENVTTYEVGLKTDIGNRTRFNFSAYYNDYSDIQIYTLENSASSAIPLAVLDNASSAETRGFEFEITSRPLQGLDLMLGGAFLDARFPSDDPNYAHNRFAHAPKTSLNGLARYEYPIGQSFLAAFQMDASYQSKVYFTTDNNPALSQDAYTLVNARVSLGQENLGWEVSLFAKNIFDEEYYIHGTPIDGFGVNQLNFGHPSTYGIELSYKFGA